MKRRIPSYMASETNARIFGLNPARIVSRLNPSNCYERAVCRVDDGGNSLYIFVEKGELGIDGPPIFGVGVHGDPGCRPSERYYMTLEEALACVNGEDGSEFAHRTRPANPDEYPAGTGHPIHINSFNRDSEGRMRPGPINMVLRTPHAPLEELPEDEAEQ